MPFDLVIRNGTVIDGSGSEGYEADVAIVRDRIARIGRISEKGATEIDAKGHAVTPGFIDGHTHMDAQVMWDPLGTCSCWHGVTTVVMGNCGFSLAPVRADERNLVVQNLERAEDIPTEAMAAGIDWCWQTFPEYLDAVEDVPKGINYAAYLGHSALRTWAMGKRAMEEQANSEDLKVMSAQLEASLRAGAIGFTTTRSTAHATPDDRPVASRLSTWDEVRHLVAIMSRVGHGIFQLQPGPGGIGDPESRDEIYDRVYSLSLESGVPVTLGLFGNEEQWRATLDRLSEVNARGARMFLQTHSRGIGSVMSLSLRLPFDQLPGWSEIRSLPLNEQVKALRTPSIRRSLVDAANQGDYGNRIGAELRKPNYETVTVLERPIPPNPTVAQIAAERRIDPVEAMIDLMIDQKGKQFFVQPLGQTVSDEMRLASMKHPDTVMTFSDSGAHVGQIMDSSIQTHLLAHWTRERQAFTLGEAVRMLTSTPAHYWRFRGRGLLCEGYVADLNVFDPDRVGPAMPTVSVDLPGGAKRLKQKATGFLATVVAGQVTLQNGEHTGAYPGRLLRAT